MSQRIAGLSRHSSLAVQKPMFHLFKGSGVKKAVDTGGGIVDTVRSSDLDQLVHIVWVGNAADADDGGLDMVLLLEGADLLD